MNRISITAIALFAILAAAGCTPAPPQIHPTVGTVTLDDVPISGASVTFYPDDKANSPAVARTDDNGNFRLTTKQASDGAMAGTYKIKVTKISTGVGKSPYDPDYAQWTIDQEAAIARGEQPDTPDSSNALPEMYATQATSKLTYEVKPGEATDNTVHLKLVTAVSAEE